MSNDVNISIRRWRDALACGESLNTEKLDELQDHLEAELQQIPAQGLNEEERVLLAARRVGSLRKLEREFFDADPSYVWRRRVLWMIVGVFVLAKLPGVLMSFLTPLALYITVNPGIGVPKYLAPLCMAAGIAVFWGGGFYLVLRLMRGKPKWRGMMNWVSLHPGLAIGLFLLALFISRLIGEFTSVWLTQFARPIDLGYMAIWQSIGATATGVVIPIAFGFIAWSCVRRPSVA